MCVFFYITIIFCLFQKIQALVRGNVRVGSSRTANSRKICVLLRHNCVYLVLLAATAASVVVLFLVVRDQVSGVYNLD